MNIPNAFWSKIVGIFIFMAFIVLQSCDSFSNEKENSTNREKTSTAEEVVLGSVNYIQEEYRSGDCNANCAEVTVNYPQTGDQGFDRFFQKTVKEIIDDYLRNSDGARSIEEYAELYLDSYQEFKSAFPDAKTPWYLRIDAEITYQTTDWFSLKLVTDSYSGGAHPNSSTELKLISSTGRTKRIEDVVKDIGRFRQEAERAFRKIHNIEESTRWEDTEFMFEDNVFSLPENIGFNNKGAVLYYNNYEAASYAEGPTELLIPYGKIKEQINF